MHAVYMAINLINGKRYIGVTGKGMKHRAQKHWEKARAGGRECPKFYDALRKYGKDGFAWKILCTRKGMAEAYRREFLYVDQFRPEYNTANGGLGAPGLVAWNKRAVVCLETGAEFPSAMAAAKNLNADLSEVCKALRGERRIGSGKHFCYAVDAPLDEIGRLESIHNIDVLFSVRQRRVVSRPDDGRMIVNGCDKNGRKAGGPIKASKPVRCLDDGKIFESASAAARHYDLARSSVSQLCSLKYKSKMVCGYRFEYVEKGSLN